MGRKKKRKRFNAEYSIRRWNVVLLLTIDFDHGNPRHWNSNMSEYLGKDVPKIFNGKCDEGEGIEFGAWLFNPNHYILKKPINTNGFKYFGDKVMEVSDDRIEWVKKVVFGKKNRYYLTWGRAETINEANERSQVFRWKHARPVKTKITLQEIAEKFGLDKDEIEIIDFINNNKEM